MIRVLFLVVALAAITFQLAPGTHVLKPDNVNGYGSQRDKRDAPSTESQNQCGKVIQNAGPVPLILNGQQSAEGQWPWHVALYQTQKVDNKYICGGTLLSPRHVITAAHCTTRRRSTNTVNKNSLIIHLGKHNLRTSSEGVQLRLVEKITVHPKFNASTYKHNLAIIELKEPVAFTAWVQPVCIWPENQEDLSTIVGKKGLVVGWGLDETGEPSEELKIVEMPVVDQENCIRSYPEFFARFTSDVTYCAGGRNGVSVCNGDSGGGMVFKNGDSWYLRGLASLSIAKKDNFVCDPFHYAIFADIAKMLPWIKQTVGNL